MTALRDPLAGLDFGADALERSAQDALTLDYPGQPRDKNKRFATGKMNGGSTTSQESGSTTSQESGKIKKPKLGAKERARVSSGILTDHPNLKPGDWMSYEYGRYSYYFKVIEPGTYEFHSRNMLK